MASSNKSSLVPEASAVVDTAEFVELVNNCGVIRWDGFHGKHPKNVHDGEMFRFSACVNGEKTIEADGSETGAGGDSSTAISSRGGSENTIGGSWSGVFSRGGGGASKVRKALPL